MRLFHLVDPHTLLREEEEHCKDTTSIHCLRSLLVCIDKLLKRPQEFGLLVFALSRVKNWLIEQV